MSDLTLTQIWIYPIKSLAGISLQSAKVLPKGLQYDRRWMLVDEYNNFITQRVHSEMALFRPSIEGANLVINHNEHSVSLPLESPPLGPTFNAQIWDDNVCVSEVSSELSQWFSEHLGIKCRLVCFPEENERRVNPDYVADEEHVGLADAYPFLIIGQSSLDDLNQKLPEPLSIKRFRPNLVFTGGAAFEEDSWKHFTVGTTHFRGVKPCDRCVLTTVDPETGEKGAEPLRTLSTYRKLNNKIYFGQNLITVDPREIKVGDHITLKTL